jgi:hypothetical protein
MKQSSAWMGWRRRAPATGGVEAPPRSRGTTPYRTAPPAPREEEEADTGTGEGAVIGVLVFVLLCSLLRLSPIVRGLERFGLDPCLALLASVFSGYHLVQAVRGRCSGRGT